MSNPVFFINPVTSWWLIVILSVLLFSFFTWKETKRPRKFLALRITAQLLVLISILGILLKPGFVQEKGSAGILLLTSGYNKKQVDSLYNVYPGVKIFHLPDAGSYRDSEELKSSYDLTDISGDIRFIIGEGLPPSSLELMDKKNFQFLPATQPKGIVNIQLPETVKSSQLNTLHGLINADGNTTIVLSSPGGAEDSVTINEHGASSFFLNFRPKQPGLFAYGLSIKDESGKRTEPLPVEVQQEQKLTVLFLQKFPGFEVRQLKNFLAEKGQRLALRYQVSKSNYRYEFANLPSLRMAPLTSSLLESFDLVITDGDALKDLSSGEKNLLEKSVKNGLGLIILMNSTAADKRFLPIEMKRITKDTAQLLFASKYYTLPALPLQLSETPNVYPVTKNKSRILSAYSYLGLGKTGIQLLQETYRIALEGNIEDYASLWAPLLEKTARSKTEEFRISLENNFPVYPDEPILARIISATNEVPSLIDNNVELPLTEHVMIDNVWYGKTWAGKPGWHHLTAGSSVTNYFVCEPDTWKSLRTANQLRENKAAESAVTAIHSQTITEKKYISSLVFYLMFLFASGFLWLAPKI